MSLLPNFERLKVQLGLQEEKEKTRCEELQECVSCPPLSYEERLGGFALCFGAGMFLTLTSMFSFARLLRGYPRDFAIKYTCGNLIAICSTAFLIGPRKQIQNMSHERRWIAALVWLGAMAMTLISALAVESAELTTLCILVQFGAGIWCVRACVRLCKPPPLSLPERDRVPD
jgi:hypothetical protein